jgi:very-short-patch-repair endonuclease
MFPGFGRSKPEILIPFSGNARSPIARVIRTRRFDGVATTTIGGFLSTSVAETLLTLAASNPGSVVERLVDSQLAAKNLNTVHFDPIFEDLAHARVRGLAALKRIVRARDSDSYQPPMSELERHLHQLLQRESVPESTTQEPFTFERLKATVDAFIPSWRLIVEADGRRWHTRERDFERDRLRDNEAAAAGYRIVRFTYRMLVHETDQCHRTLLRVGSWRITT